VIGIDFDNTLICYDDVFRRLGVEAGLLAPGATLGQKAVREEARRSPEGDLAWQRLQGQAYGPRIHEATAADGALDFLVRCHDGGLPTWIISHKTPFAALDPTGTNLRDAAQAWLARQGFFGPATGLGSGRLCFGATRREKIAHIRNTGCTHFIDDLEETFREPDFPPEVQGILYLPGEAEAPKDLGHLWVARCWTDISSRLFHE
jgi:hypothetical protein